MKLKRSKERNEYPGEKAYRVFWILQDGKNAMAYQRYYDVNGKMNGHDVPTMHWATKDEECGCAWTNTGYCAMTMQLSYEYHYHIMKPLETDDEIFEKLEEIHALYMEAE